MGRATGRDRSRQPRVLLFELGDARAALALLDERTRQALPEFGLELGINRAVLLARLGDPVRSLQVLDSLPGTAGAEASIRVDRAVAHRMLGDLGKSADEAEAAIAVAREQGDLLEQMRGHYQLARAREEQGDLAAAQQAAEIALDLASESGSPEGGWSARTLLARLSHEQADPAATDRYLEEALGSLETTRRTTPDLVLRATFQGSWREVYETAHSIWVERAEAGDTAALARAFDVVQRAKSRSLLDVLSSAGERGRPRTLEDVRSRLDEDGLLLEFFVGEERAWRWSVRRDGARVDPIEDAEGVATLTRDLVAAVREGNAGTAIGERLGNALLPAAIEGSVLHVAPDSFLHELPFEVLRREDSYLGETHVLVYWPSGSFVGPASPPDAEPRFAAIGAPRPPETAPAGTDADRWQIWSTPLPEARAEIEGAITGLGLPSSPAYGDDATESAFWALTSSGRASVLHVAAHAVVDPEPGASAILLSPGGGDDGILRQQEIAGRSLDAGLAVLAACRTVDLAGGRTGDALNSLTGAFLAAGAEAVMASRWEVPDTGSRVLMEQFYYYLGEGLSAAEALRAARQRLIAAGYGDRPEVWAAYVMVGDARITEPPGYRRSLVALAVIALLAAAAASWAATRRQLPSDVS